MKSIQQILSVIVLFLFCNQVMAQGTIREGKITYEITYPDMEMDDQMAAMMPTESVVYIKSNLSRTETAMGMGMSSVTLMNSKTNEVTLMMDMMGTKTATVMKDEDDSKGKADDDMKFELVKETKNIAGIECKKAIMKNSDGTSFDMYYTESIDSKSQFSKQWKKFNGFPMEYSISTSGFNMKMTAKSISEEKVPDELFTIPPDFKIMTEEEFSKMMGGQ